MNQRPEYDIKRTGENLKRLRQACGYSAELVRSYVGIGTVQAVYKWERGECLPTLDNFFALAELYRVRPEQILVRKKSELEGYVEVEGCVSKERTRPLDLYYFHLVAKSGFGI